MPKLLRARPPVDDREEKTVRRLAASRHAPADWIQRAEMVARSWDGDRTTRIADDLGCHPETVRLWLRRFNADGIDGFAERPGRGRRPRLTETERGQLIALVAQPPPGQATRAADGTLVVGPADAPAHWTLDALAEAAQARGIVVKRSQVRRILLKERVRWRQPRSWADSMDPDFVPKGRRSSRATSSRETTW